MARILIVRRRSDLIDMFGIQNYCKRAPSNGVNYYQSVLTVPDSKYIINGK